MFSKFELTNKGVELLNRVIAEQKTLKFTKFQIGKGDFSGDKKTLTQLVSKIDEFNVSQTNVLADGITNIKGFYDNRNLSVASKLTEIGIMAQLGNDSLTEVLFSYSNQPNTEAETIPAKASYFSRTFSVMNRTDNVTSVTFDLTIRQDKYNFGTLAEMKAADYLDVGDKVTLWGNAALGDSSFKMYIITDQTQPMQLNNKLYAKEYFKIVNDLKTGGANNALSGDMGKKLNVDGYTGNGNGTFRLENSNPSTIKKSGAYMFTNIKGENLDFYPDRQENYYGFVSNYDKGNGGLQIIQQAVSKKLEMYARTSRYYTSDTTDYTGWEQILTNKNPYFLGNGGSDALRFIQDSGAKYRNWGYVDRDTKKIYICIPTDPSVSQVNDVTVTSNFTLATNFENSKKIYELSKNVGFSFNLNKIQYSNGIQVNTATYNNINLTIQENGIYIIMASNWNLTPSNDDAISVYKNGNKVGFAPGSVKYNFATSVSLITQCNKGDVISIISSQTAHKESPSYTIFRM